MEECWEQPAARFCRICSSLLSSVDVMELQTAEAQSNFELHNVKCSAYLYVQKRLRPKTYAVLQHPAVLHLFSHLIRRVARKLDSKS
jgi:hypothetical protein